MYPRVSRFKGYQEVSNVYKVYQLILGVSSACQFYQMYIINNEGICDILHLVHTCGLDFIFSIFANSKCVLWTELF